MTSDKIPHWADSAEAHYEARAARPSHWSAEEWRRNDEYCDPGIFLSKAWFLLVPPDERNTGLLTITLVPDALGPRGWERLQQAFYDNGFSVQPVYEKP